jgi:hypothetical protein
MPRVVMRRSLAGLVLTIVSASWGGSSTSPSPLPFGQGLYAFGLGGSDAFSFGSGSSQPGCVGLGTSGLGNLITTAATMSLEGGVWVARPATADAGSFELRFSTGPEGPGAPGGGPGIAATASGVVINTTPDFPSNVVRDVRVILSTSSQPTASIAGGVSMGGFVASGYTPSVVVMSNSTGTSISCHAGAVSWALSRIVGTPATSSGVGSRPAR